MVDTIVIEKKNDKLIHDMVCVLKTMVVHLKIKFSL